MSNPICRRRQLGNPYPMLASHQVNASSQFWSVASNSSLQMGSSVDMTAAGWVYFNSFAGSFPNVLAKYAGASARDYLLQMTTSTGQLTFKVENAANTAAGSITDSLVMTPGQWYFIVARYDGSNLSLSINNAALQNSAWTQDIFSSSQQLTFGSNDGAGGSFLDGLLDSWGIWKSSRGNGGALSTAQISFLYNGGVGVAYRDLPGSLKSNLVAWWNFDGNGNDASGNGNNLTGNNGITFVGGKR